MKVVMFSIDEPEPSELEHTVVIQKVSEQHDIGLLKFDRNAQKVLLPVSPGHN